LGLGGLGGGGLGHQLGEVSLPAAWLADARGYFERFLRDFPTNNRRFNVEQKLVQIAELERTAVEGGRP